MDAHAGLAICDFVDKKARSHLQRMPGAQTRTISRRCAAAAKREWGFFDGRWPNEFHNFGHLLKPLAIFHGMSGLRGDHAGLHGVP